MDKIAEKLLEPSTWRGIIALVGAVGLILKPENAAAILAAVLALIGAINVARTEPSKA